MKNEKAITVAITLTLLLSFCILPNMAHAQSPLNLRGYWSFDEDSGTIAHDSSGNVNTGTLTNGPVWTNGISGTALYFDGVDDYVDVSNSPSLTVGGTQVTFEFWFKPAITLSSDCPGINFAEKGDEYGFQMSAGDPRIWFVTVLEPGSQTNWQGIQTVTDEWLADEWYYLVGTYDGTSIKVYVNGVLENSRALTGDINVASFPFTIGCHTFRSQYFFNGAIDEVKIYDYARTAEEIHNDYLILTPTPTPTPTSTPTIEGGDITQFLLIIIAILAIAVVVAVVALRQKKKQSTKTEAVPSRDFNSEAKQFCLYCGAELPPGSKFCGKCGKQQ